jgi:hypothetical protein
MRKTNEENNWERKSPTAGAKDYDREHFTLARKAFPCLCISQMNFQPAIVHILIRVYWFGEKPVMLSR